MRLYSRGRRAKLLSIQMDRVFGRIPLSTIELYQNTVQSVTEKVLSSVPQNADADLRAFTLNSVLSTVFRDWNENDNKSALTDADLDDLATFVRLAASLAGKQILQQGRPVYEACLQGMLADWLYNWNAPSDKSAKTQERF